MQSNPLLHPLAGPLRRWAPTLGLLALLGSLNACDESPVVADSQHIANRQMAEREFSTLDIDTIPTMEAVVDSSHDPLPEVQAGITYPGDVYMFKYEENNGYAKIFIHGAGVYKPKYVIRRSIVERKLTKVNLNWVPSNIIPNANAFTAIIPCAGQEELYLDQAFNGDVAMSPNGREKLLARFEAAGTEFYRNRASVFFSSGDDNIYKSRHFTEFNFDDPTYLAAWDGSNWIAMTPRRFSMPDKTIMTWWDFGGATRFRITFTATMGDNFVYMDKTDQAKWAYKRLGKTPTGYSIMEVYRK